MESMLPQHWSLSYILLEVLGRRIFIDFLAFQQFSHSFAANHEGHDHEMKISKKVTIYVVSTTIRWCSARAQRST